MEPAPHPSIAALGAIYELELGAQLAAEELERLLPAVTDAEIHNAWKKGWQRLAKLRPQVFRVPPRLLGRDPIPHALSFLYAHQTELSHGGLVSLAAGPAALLAPRESWALEVGRRRLRRWTSLGALLRPGRFFLMSDEHSLALRGERHLPCGAPNGIAGLSLCAEPRLRSTAWFWDEQFEKWQRAGHHRVAGALLHEELHAAFARARPGRHLATPFVSQYWEEATVAVGQCLIESSLRDMPLEWQELAPRFQEHAWAPAIGWLRNELAGTRKPEDFLASLSSTCLGLARIDLPGDAAAELNRRFGRSYRLAEWEGYLTCGA